MTSWAAVRRAYLGTPPIEALYQPIEHPDFDGWPVVRACADRMSLMTDALDARGLSSGTVIDLGCHTGWFCRAFARRGWTVIGIDRSAPWLAVARAMNAHVTADPLPRYELANVEAMEIPAVDVALCLSCAMYLSWDRGAWDFFRRLSERAPVLFMDFGGMYGDRLPFTEADVLSQVVARTRYTAGHRLGHTGDDSRGLWMFTR